MRRTAVEADETTLRAYERPLEAVIRTPPLRFVVSHCSILGSMAGSATRVSPVPIASAWRRLRIPLALSVAMGLLLGIGWDSGLLSVMIRTVTLAMVGVIVFTMFERWPKRLPRVIARWVLQVLAVGAAMPIATFVIYVFSTEKNAPPFWSVSDRLEGFTVLTVLGILLAPWTALGALVRQKEALARHQALEFELERSELEREALGARLHLLHAQVAPHFLFNTLANVQALVEAGSPQAAPVLRSLITYLRAAVPMLNEPVASLQQEVELARAYLELMHMRMPDRLEFTIDIDEGALQLRCPPTTLLTLVENAVRHGIDPAEEGGRIDVQVERLGERCVLRVSDSGAGMEQATSGLGTGLATLRERLRLIYGDAARLTVKSQLPRGVVAEVEIPASGGAA